MKTIRRSILEVTALAALLSATGCVKFDGGQPTGPQTEERPIAFPAPIVSTATKAATDNRTAYPEESSFGVYGLYYASGNFSGWESTPGTVTYIDGVEFAYDEDINDSSAGSGAWISDPAYYWPKTGKMTFGAWSPYSVKAAYGDSFSYGATGLQITGFDSGADAGCDLMYSERVYDKSSSSGTSTSHDGIDLVFHHALAALHFTSEASSGISAKVAVSKIVLWGIHRQADFSENVSEQAGQPAVYSSGPEWTMGATGRMYTRTDSLVLSGDNLSAYIIPQEIGSDAKMRVYYTVQVGDGTPIPAVSQDVELSGRTVDDGADVLSEWEMARRYNYNLILGATMIRFTVNVREWGGDKADIND